MNEPSNILPTWAPRLKQADIRRLYESDAQGLFDEELVNAVGWGLRARCQSFITAVEAARGRATCPVCETVIMHNSQPEEVLVCPQCGWQNTWKAYFATFQHKQLSGADEIMGVFQEFIEKFPRAKEAHEKMLLIDILLHAFHWNMRFHMNTRAAGVNLIEGRYHEVVEFLDRLSYGPGSTPGVVEHWEKWREEINRTAEQWGDEKLKRT